MFAPRPGARPSRLFLAALKNVLETTPKIGTCFGMIGRAHQGGRWARQKPCPTVLRPTFKTRRSTFDGSVLILLIS
jgi:hypothetical protein